MGLRGAVHCAIAAVAWACLAPTSLAAAPAQLGRPAASSSALANSHHQPQAPRTDRAALQSLERRLVREVSRGNLRQEEFSPNTLQLVVRAAALLFIFLPVVLLAPLAALSAAFREAYWFGLLARTVGVGGIAFIKWAQWASTRTDLLPGALCRTLGTLRAGAPIHSRRHTRRLVERAVGDTLSRFFDSFHLWPIASGSVAQVHFGVLKGVRVAVKVRHPHVVARIATDFVLMRAAARAVARLGLLPGFDLEETVRQFSAVIGAQTQLQNEARHLILMRKNFARWPDCVFPKPLLATTDVLVETFEDGRHVSDWTDPPRAPPDAKRLAAPGKGTPAVGDGTTTVPATEEFPGHDPADDLSPEAKHFVVTRGEDVYLKMLLSDNLMHADLHPGNILLRQPQDVAAGRGCSGARVRRRWLPWRRALPLTIVFCDLGMVAVLTEAEQEHFLGLMHSMGNADGRAAARHVLQWAEEQPLADRAGFEEAMARLFADKCRGYGTAPDFGEVVRGVLAAVRDHRVRVSPNYMTLVINAMCLDAMARVLQPSYNVLDAAKPLLRLHERVPRAVFAPLLPFARLAKALRDRRHMRQLKRRRSSRHGRR